MSADDIYIGIAFFIPPWQILAQNVANAPNVIDFRKVRFNEH